jgi:hypothetical protein
VSTISPEAQRVLRRAAERLAGLQKHPSFTLLTEKIEEKRVRMRDSLTARLMGGEPTQLLQRQIDYDRGFIDGALYGKAIVDNAVRDLEEWEAGEAVTETEEGTDGWPGYR